MNKIVVSSIVALVAVMLINGQQVPINEEEKVEAFNFKVEAREFRRCVEYAQQRYNVTVISGAEAQGGQRSLSLPACARWENLNSDAEGK